MREEGDLLHYDHQSERSDVRRRPANTQPRGGRPLQRGPEKAEVTPARGPRPGAACACVENEPRVALLSRSSTSSSAPAQTPQVPGGGAVVGSAGSESACTGWARLNANPQTPLEPWSPWRLREPQ